VYSTEIAPPAPIPCRAGPPPFVSILPPLLVIRVAVIQTEPPAPERLLIAPFATIAPLTTTSGALIRTTPPPGP
jgi:hypothetical protein